MKWLTKSFPFLFCSVLTRVDVRNTLFGMPSQGGIDLAAFDIQRSRDLGVPLYNDAREYFGLGRSTLALSERVVTIQ